MSHDPFDPYDLEAFPDDLDFELEADEAFREDEGMDEFYDNGDDFEDED